MSIKDDATPRPNERAQYQHESGEGVALEYQQSLQAARDNVAWLKRLVSDQEIKLGEGLEKDDKQLDQLQIRREEILASIAAGEATQEALAGIDSDISDLVEDGDGSRAAGLRQFRDVNQTLSGLRRRLATAEGQLVELESQKSAIVRQLIISKAERLGGEYIALAHALRECFMRLVGLDELANELAGHDVSRFFHPGGYPLFLPAPRLGVTPSATGGSAEGVLFSAAREAAQGGYLKQRQVELEELASGDLSGLVQEVFLQRL